MKKALFYIAFILMAVFIYLYDMEIIPHSSNPAIVADYIEEYSDFDAINFSQKQRVYIEMYEPADTELVIRAMEMWNKKSEGVIEFTRTNDKNNADIFVKSVDKKDPENKILGITLIFDNKPTNITFYFKKSEQYTDAEKFQAILHEFGHALGLFKHADDADNALYGTVYVKNPYNKLNNVTLSKEDLLRVKYLPFAKNDSDDYIYYLMHFTKQRKHRTVYIDSCVKNINAEECALTRSAIKDWEKTELVKFYETNPQKADTEIYFQDTLSDGKMPAKADISFVNRKLKVKLYIARNFEFETGLKKLSKDETKALILHELGYALGLQLSDNENSVMYTQVSAANKITAEDIKKAKNTYNKVLKLKQEVH